MPGAVAELAALGVHPHGRPLTGIHYLDADGRGPRRDGALRRRARTRRAPHRAARRARRPRSPRPASPVEQRAVQDVRDAGDHVLVDGEPARYLVAADGLHSPVRRLLGLDAPAGRAGAASACAATSQQAPWTSYVEVHWSPRAEAYVTPVDDDLVGVAVLGDAGVALRGPARRLPACSRERLTGARTRVMGAGPAAPARALAVGRAGPARRRRRRLRRRPDRRGHRPRARPGARRRRRASPTDRPDRYDGRARRLGLAPRAAHARPPAGHRPPAVRRALVPAASRLPWLFGAAVNQLARPVGGPHDHADATSTTDTVTRELVVLLDEDGQAVGTADKAGSTTPTPRCTWPSPATSSTTTGRVLVTRRALTSGPSRACGPTAAAATPRPARTSRTPYAAGCGRSSAPTSPTCGWCCRASATAPSRTASSRTRCARSSSGPRAGSGRLRTPTEVDAVGWEPWAEFRAGVLDGTRDGVGVVPRAGRPAARGPAAAAPADVEDDLPPAARPQGEHLTGPLRRSASAGRAPVTPCAPGPR